VVLRTASRSLVIEPRSGAGTAGVRRAIRGHARRFRLAHTEHLHNRVIGGHHVRAALDDLSSTAVQAASGPSPLEQEDEPRQAKPPGEVTRALAQTWSFCVWNIASSKSQVAPDFRAAIIKEYFLFILRLGWQPSKICFNGMSEVEGLTVWRDLFMRELRSRFSERGFLRWMPLQELERGHPLDFEGEN
jgi:hypothetical protein